MTTSDPVSDMIVRIKNANSRRKPRVDLPHSRLKQGVAEALKREGYLSDVRVTADDKAAWRKTLHLYLKYDVDHRSVITDIVRISRPGRRVFRPTDRLGKVLDGLGISVLSTSSGVLSDREARRKNVGGEMICKVW